MSAASEKIRRDFLNTNEELRLLPDKSLTIIGITYKELALAQNKHAIFASQKWIYKTINTSEKSPLHPIAELIPALWLNAYLEGSSPILILGITPNEMKTTGQKSDFEKERIVSIMDISDINMGDAEKQFQDLTQDKMGKIKTMLKRLDTNSLPK